MPVVVDASLLVRLASGGALHAEIGELSRHANPDSEVVFVPALTATGFTTLAWILVGFLVISGVIGLAWAPRNEGKSLEQLEAERM